VKEENRSLSNKNESLATELAEIKSKEKNLADSLKESAKLLS